MVARARRALALARTGVSRGVGGPGGRRRACSEQTQNRRRWHGWRRPRACSGHGTRQQKHREAAATAPGRGGPSGHGTSGRRRVVVRVGARGARRPGQSWPTVAWGRAAANWWVAMRRGQRATGAVERGGRSVSRSACGLGAAVLQARCGVYGVWCLVSGVGTAAIKPVVWGGGGSDSDCSAAR
jgi:hypothetical protein